MTVSSTSDSAPVQAPPTSGDSALSITDLLILFWRDRRQIVWITGCAALVSLAIALLIPKVFTSSVTALPPAKKGDIGGLARYADLASMAGMSLPGGQDTSVEEILAILDSTTLRSALMEQCGLVDSYRLATSDDRLQAFGFDFRVTYDKKSSRISFAYTHRDPRKAAEVVNAAARLLQERFNDIHRSASRREREFLEGRVKLGEAELVAAAERLAVFQRENNAVELEAQTKATVEAVGLLQGQLIGQQVELRALLATAATTDNPQIQLLQQKVDELAKAIGRLVGNAPGDRAESGAFLNLGTLPEVGARYLTLFREVKKGEALLTALISQVESARINEVRNAEVITIIDPGRVPERKSGPKRAMICIEGTALGLLAGLCWVLFKEPLARFRGQLRQKV